MAMCKPTGGTNKMFGKKIDDSTKDDKNRSGKPNSRTDLYPDEQHQESKDRIMSRWFDSDGWAIKDRDFSDHGFPEKHKNPHDHTWKRLNGELYPSN
ncbi:MAG: hypothetical protein FWE84_01315 [Firmicutes bacterium]|nr:hypothetical protein [Bacillota bacterium]